LLSILYYSAISTSVFYTLSLHDALPIYLPGTGDLFAVYPGRRADPLNGPVIWRDLEKDGLKSPEFKAFQKFRKQVEESEKSHKPDRKSTRLNSSHLGISYAVFCLKKKRK